MKKEVMQIGNIKPTVTRDNPNQGRVYSIDGIAPAITDISGGGGRQPFILSKETAILTQKRTDYGKKMRKDYEARRIDETDRCEVRRNSTVMGPRGDGLSNTITTVQSDNMVLETVKVRQATAKGYAECVSGGVFDASYPESKTRRGRVQGGGTVAPTLTAVGNAGSEGICRVEPGPSFIIGGKQQNAFVGNGDCSPSLTQAMGDGGGHVPMMGIRHRIRRLTPRECWRLMGFSDLDFFTAMLLDREAARRLLEKHGHAGTANGKEIMREAKKHQKTSDTQLYRMAGNSIVRNVLMDIFRPLVKK